MKSILITIFIVTLITIASLLTSNDEQKQKENRMSDDTHITIQEAHQKFAVSLNNLVWNLLGKNDRTPQETDLMINAAHGSRLHWEIVGTEINLQRGEWLISRVYSVLNRPEPALYHAEKCLALTNEHNFVDFDLAYAYEAMARAFASQGDSEETKKYLLLATEAGEKIEADENKSLFFDDLNSEPWYSMK